MGCDATHFLTDGAFKLIVDQSAFDQMKGVLDALWSTQRTRLWFTSEGPAELSLVWEDPVTELLCKARLDKVVHRDLIADLKTTRDATRFEKSMVDYGYDRQAAFYSDGYRILTGNAVQFAFAAVESDAPHGVRAAPASPDVISSGRHKYRKALAILEQSLAINNFSDDYEQPDSFDLPRYAKQETLTLYHGGEPIEVHE